MGGGKHCDNRCINIAKLNSLLLTLTVLLAFCIGTMQSPILSDAATGSLNSTESVWFGTDADNGATMIVKQTGKYRITMCGGGGSWKGPYSDSPTVTMYGGKIIGSTLLEKNDTIEIVTYDGGAGAYHYKEGSASSGYKAIMLFVNGQPMIGAGGAGGSSMMYGHAYGGVSQVTELDNSKFSAGAGGSVDGGKGKVGETMAGCVPAQPSEFYSWGTTPMYSGGAGANYLNDEKVAFIEMPNESTGVEFKVEYMKATSEDVGENTAQIARQLQVMNETMSKGNSTHADTITVVKGREFIEVIDISNDNTIGGTDSGVTVINSNIQDGVVKVLGNISSVGIFQVTIDNIIYTIKVIEEPSSSSISYIL